MNLIDLAPVIYIVDDDADARSALVRVANSMHYKVISCVNAEEFLSIYDADVQSCLVTDLRMQGMSGLELLRHMKASGKMIPTVIISGYAETPVAVDSMLAGAVSFLEKTAPQHHLCEAILRALKLSQQQLIKKVENERIRQTLNSFTAEERKILQLVAKGKLNKEIAFEIGAPLRTIEDRRRRLMSKIGADSIVDLVRFALSVEQLEENDQTDSLGNDARA